MWQILQLEARSIESASGNLFRKYFYILAFMGAAALASLAASHFRVVTSRAARAADTTTKKKR